MYRVFFCVCVSSSIELSYNLQCSYPVLCTERSILLQICNYMCYHRCTDCNVGRTFTMVFCANSVATDKFNVSNFTSATAIKHFTERKT